MDTNKIEEQLKKIPEEIKKIFFSLETSKKIQVIGEENGLLLDQIDDLIEEVGLTIIGLKSAKNFVSTINKKLRMDSELAEKITKQINEQILSNLKKEHQFIAEESKSMDNNSESAVASVEKIGGFSIEREEKDTTNNNGVTADDKEKIISGIENPEPSKGSFSRSLGGKGDDNSDQLVDYLMNNPVGQPENKVKTESGPKTQPSIDAQKNQSKTTVATDDPYREPIK